MVKQSFSRELCHRHLANGQPHGHVGAEEARELVDSPAENVIERPGGPGNDCMGSGVSGIIVIACIGLNTAEERDRRGV